MTRKAECVGASATRDQRSRRWQIDALSPWQIGDLDVTHRVKFMRNFCPFLLYDFHTRQQGPDILRYCNLQLDVG